MRKCAGIGESADKRRYILLGRIARQAYSYRTVYAVAAHTDSLEHMTALTLLAGRAF